MVIVIINFLAVFATTICCIREKLKCKNKQELCQNQFQHYISDFSVSGYMERVEKTGIEIMNQQQKAEPYIMVLWAGVHGLRLNDDGSFEWIRREEDKPKHASVSYHQCQNIINSTVPFQYDGCQNVSRNIDSSIQALQSQLQTCITQQQQQLQNSYLMSQLHPPYYQQQYYPQLNYYGNYIR